MCESRKYPYPPHEWSLEILACVAGVNGEGEGGQERGRRRLGARDEGTPATKTPIYSFLRPPAAAKF